MGSVKRKKPYAPSLSNKLAKRTEPMVGASTCASGNQIWKGNIGILIAKGRKKQIHHVNWSSRDNLQSHKIWYSKDPTVWKRDIIP